MIQSVLIRFISGSRSGKIETIPIAEKGEIVLGREPSLAICLDTDQDKMVSRRHAAIRLYSGDPVRYRIRDLGSTNGTYLNEKKIFDDTDLVPGDVITLGIGGPRLAFDMFPRSDRIGERTQVFGAAPSARPIRHPMASDRSAGSVTPGPSLQSRNLGGDERDSAARNSGEPSIEVERHMFTRDFDILISRTSADRLALIGLIAVGAAVIFSFPVNVALLLIGVILSGLGAAYGNQVYSSISGLVIGVQSFISPITATLLGSLFARRSLDAALGVGVMIFWGVALSIVGLAFWQPLASNIRSQSD